MKTELLILAGLTSVGLAFLNEKNKKKSKEVKEKMQRKIEVQKNINVIKESSFKNHKISDLIIKLLEDSDLHNNIGKKLSDEEILQIEKQLKIKLPISYKLFLKYFGDEGCWIYSQSIDQVQNDSWLREYRKELGKTIKLENKQINVDSLLSLMTEDSNGGAWCWLTSEENNDNEYPLVYFMDNKLHYKVENFTEWLSILVQNKNEVIRALDIEEKLELG